MTRRAAVLGFLFLFAVSLSAAFAVDVNVSSPGNNYNGPSPVNVAATATSDYPISGWVVYVDGQYAYSALWTASINTNLNVGQGTHELVVRAWDITGSYGDQFSQITIGDGGGGGGLPIPPDNALVFDNVHQGKNWGSCHDPGCAGGSGKGAYWMGQYISSPSLSGGSSQFFNSGIWANALWWHKLGPNDSASNFLADYWLYVDDNSQWASQAIEFEPFQFVKGYNYMMGTQCDVGAGVWDTWDQATGRWMHTTIPCNGFTPWTWHHIQWYMTTDTVNHQYTYVTLVVDGQPYAVNTTRNASTTGFQHNVGVQWQLDVNASGGGYHEWVDSAKLTIW